MPRKPPDDASRFIPPEPSLDSVREAAKSCTACPLHETGTQTVFGAGPRRAKIMFVGEQPGDLVKSTWAPRVMATVHPSSLLRATDAASREAEYARFVDDLRKAAAMLDEPGQARTRAASPAGS